MAGSGKKRLGQYNSGPLVANLLISLCPLSPSDQVIDPMAGLGDMLQAALRAGADPDKVLGVEIDPKSASQAQSSLPNSRIKTADAFRPSTWRDLGGPWDLVVTNPPYVRYQSLGAKESGDQTAFQSLGAKESENQAASQSTGAQATTSQAARQGVAEIIQEARHLACEDGIILSRLIEAYSGLADLAVPSWLLCSALVRKGGTLAMVVPESWLARDYAWAVKYALIKLFDIQYVVEDSGAAWFPEAEVKTNLVVARRMEACRERIHDRSDLYKLIRLSPKLIGPKSLVENLSFRGLAGMDAFKRLAGETEPVFDESFELTQARMGDLFGSITPKISRFLSKVEPGRGHAVSVAIPLELSAALKSPGKNPALGRLDDWGVKVGQGLRTGANSFFYAELSGESADTAYLSVSKGLGGGVIEVPKSVAIPALRSQADLDGGYHVAAEKLRQRLLMIDEEFRPDEAPTSFADHLKRFETQPVEVGGKMVLLKNLTAVRTNIRPKTRGQAAKREWYMLPSLAARHLPRLCLPRVNHHSPRCYLIAPGIVVDSNFSTLWLKRKDDPLAYAVLALMNSTWIQASLELSGAVMGGGALKVEAAHLAALALPAPSPELLNRLAALGRDLAAKAEGLEADGLLRDVDRLIARALLGASEPSDALASLRELLKQKLLSRRR